MQNENKEIVNPLAIPREILNYTFTFFNLKQIVSNRKVCKFFKVICDDMLDKIQAECTYYTIGNPVLIVKNGGRNPNLDLAYNIRKKIKPEEIISSLKSNKDFILFKTKEDALEYAHSLMKGDIKFLENMYHPAIFEVLYIGDKKFEVDKSTMKFVVNQWEVTTLFNNDKVTKESSYIEAKTHEILPISGHLEVKLAGFHKNKYKIYPPVNMNMTNTVSNNVNESSESFKKPSRKCIVQ